MAKRFKTPYADYFPRLSESEFEVLKASIKAEGVREAITVDEDDNILDGHHRYEIDPNCKFVVVPGLPKEEKEAFVFRRNSDRRHLSPPQWAEVNKRRRALAIKMNQPPLRYSQPKIAKLLGVSQKTVSVWLGEKTTSIPGYNGCKPSAIDCRVKIPVEVAAVIAERVDAGERQSDVAADFKVTQQAVSKIVAKHEAKQVEIIERQAKAKEIEDLLGDEDHGVKVGDFREVAKELTDGSVDLIFTDPPYDTASLPLYGDMAKVAARVLRDGGSLLTFGPQACIPELIDLIAVDGIKWFWVCGCVHTGKSSRMAASGIVVTWKPILWFIKGSQRYDTSVFVKDSVQSVQEKDAHPWQQSVVEARYYIDHLSPKNGMVFDPFCGGGTTAVAAKQAGRRWLTCDIHNEHALIARGRVVES